MWTLILGGVLFFCFAYVGIGIRSYYAKRRDIYRDSVSYIDYLKENIGFLKTPIGVLTRNFSKDRKGEFAKMLNKYVALIDKGCLSVESVNKMVASPYIDKERQELMSQFFYGLGKVDCDTQIEQLLRMRAALLPIAEHYDKKYRTTGVLAYRLGILLGIAVMIIAV
ncbi:MAG: hypothetical protein K2M44_01660 [Clostridia bacterium]|nr:hypothetical protein [Clostridia bacterium]